MRIMIAHSKKVVNGKVYVICNKSGCQTMWAVAGMLGQISGRIACTIYVGIFGQISGGILERITVKICIGILKETSEAILTRTFIPSGIYGDILRGSLYFSMNA